MVDSGAARSVIPKGWHSEIPTDATDAPALRTASGDALDVEGVKMVPITIGLEQVTAPVAVCTVQRAILSTNTLASAGYVTVIGKGGAHVEKGGVRVPLERDGDHFFLVEPKSRPQANSQHHTPKSALTNFFPFVNKAPRRRHGAPFLPLFKKHNTVINTCEVEDGSPSEQAGGRSPNVRPAATAPGPAEVQKHNITHVPYQPWCLRCVAGRSVGQLHKRVDRSNRAAGSEVVVQVDYAFFGKVTILVVVCTKTGMVAARRVYAKGPSDDAISFVAEFVCGLGHKRTCIQCDGEPAAWALICRAQHHICKLEPSGGVDQVRARTTLGYNSNANGAVERGIRTIKGLIRTFVSDLQSRGGAQTQQSR